MTALHAIALPSTSPLARARGVVLTGVGFVAGLILGLALRIGDRRGGKGAHVVLGALKGEHVALYKDATPARTAVPIEQPIVINEVAGQTEL